jgi:hypothetical protein
MLNHVQQYSTQESPSIVILGAREWKMELLAIWQRGFYRDCFPLSEMGIQGAGGRVYRRVGVLERGVVMMEHVTRGSMSDGGGMVLMAVMAAVGALQRGMGGGSVLQRGCGAAMVVRMEAGTRVGSMGEWWGQ